MAAEENRGRLLIGMSGVGVRRGEGPELDSINWTISEGEHWGILGDTGSGKSLLIDALMRRAPLTAGTISYFLDRDAHATPFPPPGFISSFSAEDCRRFLARRLGYVQARWEASAQLQSPPARELLGPQCDPNLLNRLGLDQILDRAVISLSSGEFRKLMLARALAGNPRLLVLEDPFSGLDRESELEFRHLLESLCAHSHPGLVVVVSQPEQLVDSISHVIVVEGHRIVQIGRRSGIPARPRSVKDAGHTSHMARPLKRRPGVALIEMKKVSVRYGDSQILTDINWTVHEGENWAIQGPNGAGKTTLLSLITGDNPQAYVNDIRLFGRRRGSGESIWDIKRQIGSVSPELQFCYPAASTALEVVCSGLFDSIGLYRTCSPEQLERATAWLNDLGTSSLPQRAFWSLSAAEQRLVLLARALIKQPRLLVLDEPCLGLDARHVARFLDQLDSLCQTQPTTILYVTHRPNDLPSTISHALRLERGLVAHAGSVGSV